MEMRSGQNLEILRRQSHQDFLRDVGEVKGQRIAPRYLIRTMKRMEWHQLR